MNTNGKVKITSLDQLKPRTSEYTITNSATGEEFTVVLRDLLPEQIVQIDGRVKRPKPPIKGFKPGGVPEFDEDDPTYLAAKEEAGNEHIYLWLLESWEVEIPGETADEKLAALKRVVPFWAFSELARRLREINGLKLSDIALEKKRSNPTNSSA